MPTAYYHAWRGRKDEASACSGSMPHEQAVSGLAGKQGLSSERPTRIDSGPSRFSLADVRERINLSVQLHGRARADRGAFQPGRAGLIRRRVAGFVQGGETSRSRDLGPSPVSIGGKLRAKRRRPGWSRKRGAKELGIDPVTPSHRGQGKTTVFRNHRLLVTEFIGFFWSDI
jgi:hypothetical protein